MEKPCSAVRSRILLQSRRRDHVPSRGRPHASACLLAVRQCLACKGCSGRVPQVWYPELYMALRCIVHAACQRAGTQGGVLGVGGVNASRSGFAPSCTIHRA